MEKIRAIRATNQRNLRLLRRRPDLLAQSVLMPIVMLLLSALIFGAGGDDWPVGVTDHAKTEQSAALVDAIEESTSTITPYFRITETDATEAKAMLDEGRMQLVIEIPPDFDRTRQVDITTYNINSDATKNLRLRVEDALNAFDAEAGNLDVTVDLRTVEPEDIPRSEFIAGGLTLLALFFGAALISANLFAVEQEQRTTKEMLLTPVGAGTAALSCMITGTAVAFLTTVPTYLTGWLAFGLTPSPSALLLVLIFMTPLMLACAGTGVLLAQMLRQHRSIQPLLILVAIATFFTAGGFVSVPGLPPAARAFAEWWPFSRIFEWNNPVLHRFADNFPTHQWAWALAAAALGALAALWAAHKERYATRAGGQ
ncbi:ABC transporter permease [Streptomyces sp. NBC_00287]|uniref:ABC transporter permease n=1 Tax=Streptomyces sp. NBC_00287 TaxID=2975702 RepID=UPI002E2A102A|nr:ABC transporter permease [Streptomyces sp. NBC_00287]